MSSNPSISVQDRLFDLARRRLNAAQRAAVDHVEGPTLVVAGPGTGKTQLLAMRVGAILTETDAQPYNILCLTFTDAAVRAMRERLLQLIGADAHKVRIFTFHSFCNRVIQDNLDLFGRQDLSPLDELERRQLLRDVLDELAPDHPLRRGRGSDVYFYEKHLADLFRLMKTEAWTTASVVEAVDKYVTEIPQSVDFQYRVTKKGLFSKGDLKTDAIEEEVQRMERLKAAAQLYLRFEGKKWAAQRYDFDDMILWVSEAFEKYPFLLRGLQEQFLYFLVDEFQDTNGAQNRILSQLIGFWEQPNVLIVGDDDQAIYEFQGARLRSLLEFYETYRQDIQLVVLNENYRSSQLILDAAKQLIDRNDLRILNLVDNFKFQISNFKKSESDIQNFSQNTEGGKNFKFQISDFNKISSDVQNPLSITNFDENVALKPTTDNSITNNQNTEGGKNSKFPISDSKTTSSDVQNPHLITNIDENTALKPTTNNPITNNPDKDWEILTKNLKAVGATAHTPVLPKIVEFASRNHEVAAVVAQIEAIFEQTRQQNAAIESENAETTPTSPVVPNTSNLIPQTSIAIVFARHRTAEAYLRLLDKKQLPYTIRRAVNVLDEPLIQNLRLLLTYLVLESRQAFGGEHLVFKLLTINFLQINQKDLLTLARFVGASRLENFEDFSNINSTDLHGTVDAHSASLRGLDNWRTTLTDLPNLNFVEKNKLVLVSQKLNNWIQAVHNVPLTVFLEKIINQSGLLAHILRGGDSVKNTQIVNTLIEFVRREVEKKPRLSLADLLKTLDLMDANGLRLEWLRQDLNVDKNGQNTEGVILTTAHGAKGLEFDYVFVVDAVESEWEEAKTNTTQRFKLPPTLTYTAEADATEARRRLFYVAATRARTHLQVSFSRTDVLGKPLSMSQFVSELGLKNIEKQQLTAEKLFDNQILQLSTPNTEGGVLTNSEVILPTDFLENAFIAETLRDFQISISALNTYLDCPLSFYFEHLLNIPSEPSPAFHYGSAVHFALRKLFGEMLRDKEKIFPNLPEFLHYFEADLTRRQQYFDPTDFQNRLISGKSNLMQFYTQNIDIFSKNVLVERTIVAHIGGIPARGVLDKIEFRSDNTAHIVDYKTGKPNDADTRRPTAKNPNGGAYWRQLVFYKLLYENYRANLVRVTTGDIQHLEADVKGQFKVKTLDLTTKDGEILRGVISGVWEKIHAREFGGCGKKTCKWCNFIKNNYPQDSFRNDNSEELDD